jgi:uncharacterized protein YcgI (DUF1989 family)
VSQQRFSLPRSHARRLARPRAPVRRAHQIYPNPTHRDAQEAAKEHDSCTNNLYNALAELGLALAEDPRSGYYTPAPFNLWMNVTPEPDASGYCWVMPPAAQKAGDFTVFRARRDCVVALSACPWDLGAMNGEGGEPRDVEFQVFAA